MWVKNNPTIMKKKKRTTMENVSINKPRKLLIANTVCLLLIVSALLMFPLVSFVRASGSGYSAGATATFVDIMKDNRGNVLNPPDTNAYHLKKGDTLHVNISGKKATGTYLGCNWVKVNNTILK